MACDGASERRDGLIADMVKLRDAMDPDAMRFQAQLNGIVLNESDKVALFLAGYLSSTISRVAAAVITLAGPCCEDCGKDHDGHLVDWHGAPDE